MSTDTDVVPAPFTERVTSFRTVYRAARQGDAHAMRVLVASYDPLVLRYFASVDIAHPEAAAAHVWASFSHNFRRVRNEREFAIRLFAVAHAVAVAILAERTSDVRTPIFDEAGAAARLLSTMPFAEAEVLALLVIAGFEDRDIAEVTGRPAAEVAQLGTNARAMLRDLLGH